MLYKAAFSIDSISLLVSLETVNISTCFIMVWYAPNVEGSSIFEELPSLSSSTSDVYGSLLNNGLYVFQPNMNMDLDLIKAVMGWCYHLVWAVYIHSPQAAYINFCIGDEPVSPEFKKYFSTGIHRAFFPDAPERDCNVVFHPLQERLEPDRMLSLAIAISENHELPGMNLFYLHKNPGWKPSYRPKILDLPSVDDLDDIQQQL